MKEHKFFVDATLFLCLITRDNEKYYQACLQFFHKVREKNLLLLTSPIVLAEIESKLTHDYELKKEDILRALEGILALKNLKFIEYTDMPTALNFYKNKSVKLINCLIASYPALLNGQLKILSYDREFDSLGLDRLEPKEVL